MRDRARSSSDHYASSARRARAGDERHPPVERADLDRDAAAYSPATTATAGGHRGGDSDARPAASTATAIAVTITFARARFRRPRSRRPRPAPGRRARTQRLPLRAREPSVASECPHPLEYAVEGLLVAPRRHGDAEPLVASADLLAPQQPEPVRQLVEFALTRLAKRPARPRRSRGRSRARAGRAAPRPSGRPGAA